MSLSYILGSKIAKADRYCALFIFKLISSIDTVFGSQEAFDKYLLNQSVNQYKIDNLNYNAYKNLN